MPTTTSRSIAQGASTLAIGCIGLFSAFPAMAQDQQAQGKGGEGQNLGGVTVTDTAIEEGSYKVERMASPKATAPLLDTPKSITVISRQVLEDTNSTTLTEALRTVPGITMGAGEGGNPLGDRPFIRGADSQASTYLDGVRDIAAQTRETFDVEAIEVTKGSDSVTNGSGNGGGSINIVSKAPETKRFAKVEGSLGNADYKRVTVDINQPLSDFVGVRINGMFHDQGVAGRDAIWQKRWGIAPSIKFGLNGPTSLELDWYHMHSTELPDSGIPYATTISNQTATNALTAPLPTTPFTTAQGNTITRSRGAFYGLADRDFRTTNNDALTARFEHNFDSGLKLRNTMRYTNTTQEYIYTQPDDSQGNVYNTGTVWRRANTRYSKQTGFVDQVDLSGKFNTGSIKHSFAGAVEYSWQSSGYGSFVSNAATGTALSTGSTISPRCNATTLAQYYCTSAATPNSNDAWASTVSDTSATPAAIQRSAPASMTLANSSTVSASLFDTISITDQLMINLGGRYDRYSTNVSAAVAAPYTASRSWQNRTDDIFTYQAGLIFKPVPNGSFYISTGSSAVPPGSFLGQGSEDNAVASTTIDPNTLKVQKTTSYEVGTKWSLLHDQLALSLDLFQTRTTNARYTDSTGVVAFIGEKRVRGVEFGFSGNVTPQWSIFGGYTYMPSKVLNAGYTVTTTTVGTGANAVTYTASAPAALTGHAFPNTPTNSFTLFTSYKVTPKFTLGGGAIYMGRVYGGFSDSRTAGPNGVVTITKTRAVYVPDYWRFDANASYQINSVIGLRVSALNITNKLYYDQAYATHYAHQAAGRTVIGTLSIKY
ncbi:TonB-dependent receptor [Novosphingobium rosa]|uniref:TonB-dependent receptor n=1 Tax=Novosphingobium rosa TaxID=76978 RepID=UPI00082E7D7B|nr:TonB-dependent receptor [Novosphingobium rosa]